MRMSLLVSKSHLLVSYKVNFLIWSNGKLILFKLSYKILKKKKKNHKNKKKRIKKKKQIKI